MRSSAHRGAGSGDAQPKSPAAEDSWPNRTYRDVNGTHTGRIRTVYGVVDVYPVGALDRIRRFRSRSAWERDTGVKSSDKWSIIRTYLRHLRCWAVQGNWRAIRQSFNGWLAEPTWTDGPEWRRCGHAWTPDGALHDLTSHLVQVNGLNLNTWRL